MLQLLLAVFIGGERVALRDGFSVCGLTPASGDSHGDAGCKPDRCLYHWHGIGWFNRMTHIDPMWKVLITTGFCGGLTTFSTFSAETVFLFQEGRIGWALMNMAINMLGSFAMTGIAFWLFSSASAH